MKRDRDNNGRFTEKDVEKDRHTLELTFPKLNTILVWIGILLILLPWISIVMRNELIQKTFSSIEKLMAPAVIAQTNNGNNGVNPDDNDENKGKYWK
jgi:hypothetical protein